MSNPLLGCEGISFSQEFEGCGPREGLAVYRAGAIVKPGSEMSAQDWFHVLWLLGVFWVKGRCTDRCPSMSVDRRGWLWKACLWSKRWNAWAIPWWSYAWSMWEGCGHYWWWVLQWLRPWPRSTNPSWVCIIGDGVERPDCSAMATSSAKEEIFVGWDGSCYVKVSVFVVIANVGVGCGTGWSPWRSSSYNALGGPTGTDGELESLSI